MSFTCGRRMDPFAFGYGVEDQDEWINRDGAKRCSYCGSMSAEDFWRAVEQGQEIGPTDKNYKAYLPGGKFYFQHFSDADRKRFVDALNNGAMNIGFPGRFYRLPFFCKPADPFPMPPGLEGTDG